MVKSALLCCQAIPSANYSAFIFDGTTESCVRQRIEGISYVHDHVARKTILGFKYLTLVVRIYDM